MFLVIYFVEVRILLLVKICMDVIDDVCGKLVFGCYCSVVL